MLWRGWEALRAWTAAAALALLTLCRRCDSSPRLSAPPRSGAPHVKPANWLKVDWGTVQWLPFLEVMFWNL